MARKKTDFQRVNDKFLSGGSITNKELDFLVKHYTAAVDGLSVFIGDRTYYLAEKELSYRLRQLEGFQQARQEKHH